MTPYTMPAPQIGDVVLHYLHVSDKKAVPMIVGEIGDRAIGGHVFPPRSMPLYISGVRFVEDPDVKPESRNGTWDFTPRHRRNLELIEAFGDPVGAR